MRWYPAMSVSIWYTSWPRPTTPAAAAGISAAVLTRPILADGTGNIGGRLRRGACAGSAGRTELAGRTGMTPPPDLTGTLREVASCERNVGSARRRFRAQRLGPGPAAAVPAGFARPGRLGHRGGHAARPGPARV